MSENDIIDFWGCQAVLKKRKKVCSVFIPWRIGLGFAWKDDQHRFLSLLGQLPVSPHGGASGLGPELPGARHSGPDFSTAAQAAARQSFAQRRRKVFCHGGRSGTCQRPFLAGQNDNGHQPALAKAERQKTPFCEWFTERRSAPSAHRFYGNPGVIYFRVIGGRIGEMPGLALSCRTSQPRKSTRMRKWCEHFCKTGCSLTGVIKLSRRRSLLFRVLQIDYTRLRSNFQSLSQRSLFSKGLHLCSAATPGWE